LLLLASAATPQGALVATAVSGMGFALVFPSLGMEAIASVPAQSRGAALGGYAAFFDLALGVTGPVIGGLAAAESYAVAFFVVSAAVATGALLTLVLWSRSRTMPSPALAGWPRPLSSARLSD
jgi:predicted MFS family arabinose efflux permease